MAFEAPFPFLKDPADYPPPPMPYYTPLGQVDCHTCGRTEDTPDDEHIDGYWLERGWRLHQCGYDYYRTTPKGKKQKAGWRWQEWECSDCATSVFARPTPNRERGE